MMVCANDRVLRFHEEKTVWDKKTPDSGAKHIEVLDHLNFERSPADLSDVMEKTMHVDDMTLCGRYDPIMNTVQLLQSDLLA